MAQQFCELSNLTAATNPIVGHPGAGEPGTPVLYDTAVYPGGVALGPGTKSQIPTESLTRAILRSWCWRGATFACTLRVTPTLQFGTGTTGIGGGITAADPFDISIGFDIGPKSTKSSPAGADYTVLPSPQPIVRVYQGFSNDTKDPDAAMYGDPAYDSPPHSPLKYLVANYTDLEVSGGLDSLYIVPKVTVSVGVDPIYTNTLDAEGNLSGSTIYYWNNNVECTIDWDYYAEGPGKDVDLVSVVGYPTTEGDALAPAQVLTTLFVVDDPNYSEDYDFLITDSLATVHGEGKLPKIRALGDPHPTLGSDMYTVVEITSQATLTIVAYNPPRAAIG